MPLDPPQLLLCLAFRGETPLFAGRPRWVAAGVVACGRVRGGTGASLHAQVALRADGGEISFGDDLFAGPRCTVHAAQATRPVFLGHGVSLGEGAVLHGCRIADRCVVEDYATVLDGARVGAGSVIARGSVVAVGAELPAHWLCRGVPAAPVRPLEPGELALARGHLRNAPRTAPDPPTGSASDDVAPGDGRGPGWLAAAVRAEGGLRLAAGASVWFGCDLDGGHHGIEVGAGSNVQDNVRIYAMSSKVSIGTGASIEHNAWLQDCTIGDRCLVGMASFVAAGSALEPDVLLEPGSSTLPRQVLESGWLWGGRPARRIARLDAALRAMIESAAQAHRAAAAELRRTAVTAM